jgi:hypothetical protein
VDALERVKKQVELVRARTHIPPPPSEEVLPSFRPGVVMGSAPRGASQPLRPRAPVPAGEVSPSRRVPPQGNGASEDPLNGTRSDPFIACSFTAFSPRRTA